MNFNDSGFFIEFDTDSNHLHSIGGQSAEENTCPNCHKNLMLHLTLDTHDKRLGQLNFPYKFLRLFYCMRCPLAWYDFQYRFLNEKKIEVIESYNKRDRDTEKMWQQEIGIESFEQRSISLKEMSVKLQHLYAKANNDIELSYSEKYEIAKYTSNFAAEDIGGYPCVDVINQVRGTTHIPQRIEPPNCIYCQKKGMEIKMDFLASLTNDSRYNFVISFDGVQILFYLCPRCHSIHVQHSY